MEKTPKILRSDDEIAAKLRERHTAREAIKRTEPIMFLTIEGETIRKEISTVITNTVIATLEEATSIPRENRKRILGERLAALWEGLKKNGEQLQAHEFFLLPQDEQDRRLAMRWQAITLLWLLGYEPNEMRVQF